CAASDPDPSNALFSAMALSVALSISPKDVYILCAVDAISSSFVGKPSVPSASLSIDLLESSDETPNASKTLGKLLNVSNRLMAAPIDDFKTPKAAAPTATNPSDLVNRLMPLVAFSDSLPTSFKPSS